MSSKPIILLIDDDEDDRDIFAIALKTAQPDAKLITASNGPKALELLENENLVPDFIFIDLNMPYMHGTECLKKIKQIPALQHVPAIIYTTSSSKKDVEDTQKEGAAFFVVKPTSLSALSHVLQKVMENAVSGYYIENLSA